MDTEDNVIQALAKLTAAVDETERHRINGVAVKMPDDTYIEDEQTAWSNLQAALRMYRAERGF